MSHFTVLVVGSNPEHQLAPYHEFECTGTNDEYVQDIDVTEETRTDFGKHAEPGQSFLEFCESWCGKEPVPFGEEPDIEGKHKYGYVIVDEHGAGLKVIDRTNPNAKWDWYVVGGRWTGFFKVKEQALAAGRFNVGRPGIMTEAPEEGYADQCLKGDIDFEFMREKARREAVEKANAYYSWRDKFPDFESWERVRDRIGTDKIDEARKFYHDQPGRKELDEACGSTWFGPDWPEIFKDGQEKYIERQMASSFATFAVLKDGEWYERGSMGWWGCVSDEKDQDAWHQQIYDLIKDLPDDTLLTVVDCHI